MTRNFVKAKESHLFLLLLGALNIRAQSIGGQIFMTADGSGTNLSFFSFQVNLLNLTLGTKTLIYALLTEKLFLGGEFTSIRIYAKRTATAALAKFIPSSTLPRCAPTTIKDSSLYYRILLFVVFLMNCLNVFPPKFNLTPEKVVEGGAYSGETPTGPAVRL
jgi:hypothetical protein